MTAKLKHMLIWIMAGLLTFIFGMSGITKLIGMEMQLKNFESWGYPAWLRFPIGLSEIGMGVAFILPKLRKLSLLSVFPWALVAVLTHVLATQGNMILTPIAIALIAFITLWLLKGEKIPETGA